MQPTAEYIGGLVGPRRNENAREAKENSENKYAVPLCSPPRDTWSGERYCGNNRSFDRGGGSCVLYVQRAGADPCVEVCFTSPSLVVLAWIVLVVPGARYAQNTEERRADSTRNTEHTSRSAAFTSPPGRSTTGSSARISTLPNRTLPERAFMVHLHRVTSGHGRRRRRSSGVRKDIGLRRQYNQSYRS